jgi:hypothetical protein
VDPLTKTDVNSSILINELEPQIISKLGLGIEATETPVFNQLEGYSSDELLKVNLNQLINRRIQEKNTDGV